VVRLWMQVSLLYPKKLELPQMWQSSSQLAHCSQHYLAILSFRPQYGASKTQSSSTM
jgi:hypothetical protein